MFNLGTAIGYLQLNASQIATGVRTAISAINKLPQATRNATGDANKAYKENFFALRDIAGALTGISDAAAAGFGGAVRAAVEWQTALAGVERTTFEAATAQETQAQAVKRNSDSLKVLSDQLLDLAARKPIPTTDLAHIAEEAGALGLRKQDIAGFTGVIADLAATTDLSADDATSALARIGNIMDRTNPQYERMASTTLELGRSTAATEGEIVSMARRIAGTGKTVGLSTDQVLAYAAALASVGVREEQGGAAISRTFIDIQNAISGNKEDLQSFAAVAGQTGDDFKAAFQENAGQATAAFINGLGNMQARGLDVFAVLNKLGITEVRQRDALLRLASSQGLLNDTLAKGAQAWTDNTALSQISEQRYKTVAAQVQILKNKFFEANNVVGKDFLSSLTFLVARINDLITGFIALPAPLRIGLVILVALTGVTAALAAAFIFIVPRIGAAVIALEELTGITITASAAMTGLKLVLGPIGILLTLASIAMLAYGHAQNEAAKAGDALKASQQEVADAVSAHLKGNDNLVRGWIVQKLAAENLSKSLDSVGISIQDITNLALSNQKGLSPDIVNKLSAATHQWAQEMADAGQISQKQVSDKSLQLYNDYRGKILNVTEAVKEESLRQSDLNATLKEQGIVTQDDVDAQQALNDQLEETTKAADKQNQAQIDLIDALQGQKSALNSLGDAQDKYLDAQDKLARKADFVQQQEDKITTARLNQQKATESLAEAQKVLATARQDEVDAVIKAELDLADAQGHSIDAQQKLIDAQDALDKSMLGPNLDDVRKATDKLADSYNKLAHTQQDVEDAQWQINFLMQEGASNRDIKDAQQALNDALAAHNDAIDDQIDAQKDLNKLTDPIQRAKDQAKAQRDLEQAQRDVQRALMDVTQATRDQQTAQDDLAADKQYNDALRDVQSSQIAVRDANLNLQDEIRNQQKLMGGQIERDFRDAQLNLEDAYYRVATANVEVMKQQALARGDTFTSQQQVEALKAQLLDLGHSIGGGGPVQADLLSFGAQLKAQTIGPPPIIISADASNAVNAANQVAKAMDDAKNSSGNSWTDFFSWLGDNIKRLGWDVAKWAVGDFNIGGGHDTPFVPWALGGLVTKPHLGLVGEAGPELILPLSDLSRTWQLLKENGMIDFILAQAGRNGSSLGLAETLAFASSRLSDLGAANNTSTDNSIVNGDRVSMRFVSQANPQRIAAAIAFKNRIRRK